MSGSLSTQTIKARVYRLELHNQNMDLSDNYNSLQSTKHIRHIAMGR